MPRPRKPDACAPAKSVITRGRDDKSNAAACRRRPVSASMSMRVRPATMSGHRHTLEQVIDHGIAVDAVGLRLETQQYAMA